MGKLITQTPDGRKGNISFESIQDFTFFLYLIATSAHQTGEGFDAIFIRSTFVLFLGFSVLNMVITRYFKWNSFISWFLLFLGYGYLSVIWAFDQGHVGQYTNTFVQMIGCIICLTNRIKKPEDIDNSIKMIVYSLVYTTLILFIKTPFDVWGTERIGEDIGLHSNAVGFRLALGVLLSLYLATYKKFKSFYLFVALFTIVALFTGSRKGVLIIVLELVLYILFSSDKKFTVDEVIRFFIRLVLIGIVVGVAFYLALKVEVFYNVVGYRLESMFSYFTGDVAADASMSERNFFIKKGIDLFKTHPILGYGMNNFRAHMIEINYHHTTYSHNNYIELLSTLGIIGFSIYYFMMGYMLVNCFKLFLKKQVGHKRNVALLLVLIIELVCSWWTIPYINEFSMIVYILVYMNNKLSLKEEKNE